MRVVGRLLTYLALGGVFHFVSIVEEGILNNRCPIANFYETLSMCAFLVALMLVLSAPGIAAAANVLRLPTMTPLFGVYAAADPVAIPIQGTTRYLTAVEASKEFAAAQRGRLLAAIGMVATDMTEAQRNKERLRALSRRLVQAQEAERGRVALELHDHITQLLCAILVRSKVLAGKLPAHDGPAQREALKLREMLGQTAEEVERISRDLRPSVLDELGLVAVVRDTTTGNPDLSGPIRFVQKGHLYAFSPALAFQLLPGLYLGGTINFWEPIFDRNGWTSTQTNDLTSTGQGPSPPGLKVFDTLSEKTTFSGLNGHIGILWNAWGGLTIGVVYKTPFEADLHGGRQAVGGE